MSIARFFNFCSNLFYSVSFA